MTHRRHASIVAALLFSIATVVPAAALQGRSDGTATVSADRSPTDPWSFAGIWNWIESLFDEDKGQIVP